MLIDATSFLMMLACTGFVVLSANLISHGFEALWSRLAPETAVLGEPIVDERHMLPEGRGPWDDDLL